jgi:CheY-like chemotaxis protein
MTKVILLVEDNASDEKLTLLAFRKCGVVHQMVVVRDGAEALDYLLATGTPADRDAIVPDLVLLDLKMPRVDGLEVLRRLRADERTRTLPVVILTASNEEADVRRSYELGANAYVRKPVDFTEFSAAAKTLAAMWLVLNEPAPAGRRA